ncbi:serine hydrolase domain-containing protein [Flavihumibacter sp. UBA7668]|uniref:serine hydrolase domain-containing protein n=1 Tax=Flavihumibacter sp. UBA7668 TaxID=1946542 RepID=UPI0025BE0934|nr:serine hydrolase domain-containing protein [Flavihumibacter sp. UBA7668]
MKLLLLLVFLPIQLIAQSNFSDTIRKINVILQPWTHPNLPGVSVAISRNGQLLYATAVGSADLEHGIANDTSTIFEAGSVSKQFTAAAILLLEQDGKLNVMEDVRKYIPELPNYESVITIYDLIHHQSGLRDWGSVAEVEGWGRGSRAHTNAHALQIICRQKALNNPPGTEYIYSNSNYNLMAIIVERVAKTSFAAFCKQRIFIPAGMSHTSWRNDYRQIVKNRAIAYQQTPMLLKTSMPFEDAHGNGGLLTTPSDLVKWAAFMHAGKLGGPALLNHQLKLGQFRNGTSHPYAAGLRITRFNGEHLVTHSGATAGYRANLDYFPQQRLSIAILSNTSGFSPGQIAEKIAALFIPPTSSPKPSPLPVFKAVPQEQKKLEGWYRDSRSDEAIFIQATDSMLILPGKNPILQGSDRSLYANGYKILFLKNGLIRSVTGPPVDTVQFFKEPPAVLNPSQLKQYEGMYESEEANTIIKLKAGETNLQFIKEPNAPLIHNPTYKDGFESSESTIRFIRNKNGSIKGFYISVGRARRIWFERS